MEPRPGSKTSEFKLAAVILAVATVLEIIAMATSALTDIGYRSPWIVLATVLATSVVKVLTFFDYRRGRTVEKLARLRADVSPELKKAGRALDELKGRARAAPRPTEDEDAP